MSRGCRCFGPFRLDTGNQQLRRGGEVLDLRPRTFAVLQHLIERAGQLVSKQALFDAVWPGLAVSDQVLTVCISELREALGDETKAPRFVETVYGRGYRFILAAQACHSDVQILGTLQGESESGHRRPEVGLLVGRNAELAWLRQCGLRALRGERQLVLISGAAGIGKSALAQALVDELPAFGETLWIGRGHCTPQTGPAEPYMPVLEALERIGRAPGGRRFLKLLRQHAPSWLSHLPGLIPPRERETLERQYGGASRQRMLRELAVGVEAFSAEAPLVLVVEDIHWSDHATVDLLTALVRRRTPARLLILGTYDPVAPVTASHPLRGVKEEWEQRRDCIELRLRPLAVEAVGEYLDRRFGALAFGSHFAALIHQHSGGHPLSMVTLVDHLCAEGFLGEDGNAATVPARLVALDAVVWGSPDLHPDPPPSPEVATEEGTHWRSFRRSNDRHQLPAAHRIE